MPNIQGGLDYQVTNVLAITIYQPDKTKELVTALYQVGATSVGNVSFGSSQEEELALLAKKNAIQDSKQKAKQLAKASGKRLGRIITVSDDNLEIDTNVTEDEISSDSFSRVSLNKYVGVTYSIW